MPSSSYARSLEDLSDREVERLRRIAFSAALVVRDDSQGASRRATRLDQLEDAISEAGVEDSVERRFALAQAARFLTDAATLDAYVPPDGPADEEWLRFVVEERGTSDVQIAFQIERAHGGSGAPDIATVRAARKRLGLTGKSSAEDQDTVRIIEREAASGRGISARTFLIERDWLEPRVARMSDGRIAKDLAAFGCPCDRSTVRLYRKQHGLQRKSARGS